MMHMMSTLYTDKPMCLESFSAGIDTWRVSHARNAPNTCVVINCSQKHINFIQKVEIIIVDPISESLNLARIVLSLFTTDSVERDNNLYSTGLIKRL